MSRQIPKPITIVGGGLAGLTLGVGLRLKGIPVTILEEGRYPRHRVCGEFVNGSGQGFLAKLGVHDLLLQAGARPAHDAVFIAGDRGGPVRALKQPGLSLSRFALDAVLAGRFRDCGGELRESVRWQGDYGEGLVRASGRRLQAGEERSRWFGLKVHARNVSLDADLEMHSLPYGYVGLCRLKDGQVNVCGLFRRPGDMQQIGPSSLTPQPLLQNGQNRGRSSLWKQMLCGPINTILHVRLANAVFDEDSFCSVAGLGLRPQVAAHSLECRIGDALTMTPPVTGNGMSMAFEAAELATEPLAAYSRGHLSWDRAQQEVAQVCSQAFSSRLAWARLLHWIMFAPSVRQNLAGLFLSSDLLWHILFAKTR